MSENFGEALVLLGVGMTTVFVILLIVVLVGKVIIFFVNRFVPEATRIVAPSRGITAIEPSKMAAITAAVQFITGGKGRIEKIEKK